MKHLLNLMLVIALTSCGGGSSDYSYSENEENEYIGNPYSEGTGHYAGYEWAERTGGSCDGNSQSFNEGCEEYYRQIEQ